MISGYYPENPNFLFKLNPNEINNAINNIFEIVKKKKINCIVGSAFKRGDVWYNCSIIFTPHQQFIYQKNNLSALDQDYFSAGSEIQVFKDRNLKFGVQMCRELAFPEQWKILKKQGVQIIFHINNSIKESDKVREHVLISRAFENQIWICSVNNAASPQTMSSMIINPLGNVVWKSKPQIEEVYFRELDLSLVSTQYLQQERIDLAEVVSKK